MKDIALQAFYYILETAGTPNEITCYTMNSDGTQNRWYAASMPISFGKDVHSERSR